MKLPGDLILAPHVNNNNDWFSHLDALELVLFIDSLHQPRLDGPDTIVLRIAPNDKDRAAILNYYYIDWNRRRLICRPT